MDMRIQPTMVAQAAPVMPTRGTHRAMSTTRVPICSSVEASVNRAMAPYGYRKETMLERQIGHQPAKGFRYTYTAGNTPMVGESYVIHQGRSLTFFHGYLRASMRESSLPRWQELLDGVQPL